MGEETGIGYWILDTAGVGSLIVIGVGVAVLAAYIYMLYWIRTAPREQPAPATSEETAPAQEAAQVEEIRTGGAPA